MSDIGHTKTITSRITFNQVQKLIEEKYAAGAKVKRMITWEIEDYCPSDDEWEIDIDVVHQDIYCATRNLEEITGRCYRDWETDRKSTRLNSSH